jgi:predicted 2-oxoglutarate/Fe(II)-dependent dioxygenase YbiX
MNSSHRLVVIPNFINSGDLRKIADLLSEVKIRKLDILHDGDIEHSPVRYDGKTERYIKLPSGTIDQSDNDALYKTLDEPASRIQEEIERSFALEVHPETGYSVTVYVEGTELIGHFDGAEPVLTPNGHLHRDVSSVLYLNDDFIGGVFSFDIQGIRITPKAGTLILFPGTEPFTHSVSILESGLRYVIPQFWAIKNSDDYMG